MNEFEPIGAYHAENATGWAAYDKEGRTRPVDAETGERLEADRKARNANANKPAT